MLYHTELNSNPDTTSNLIEAICYLQDVVHILTKLRNRLLKPSIVLPLGCKLVSVAHLKMLINDIPKEKHGLTLKDICPDDRQNYRSLEKVMEARVSNALTKYVVGSEGTIAFINICINIRSSLYDDDLPPIERILRIWQATYFLRVWRK